MSLARFEPMSALQNMRDEMDRMFGRLVARAPFARLSGEGAGEGCPCVDVYETDTEVVVKAEVPGIGKEDLEVRITQDGLTISGETRSETEVDEEGYHRRERRVGRFTRTLSLPSPCDGEKATASFKDGVLEIRAPKLEHGPKGIKIDVS